MVYLRVNFPFKEIFCILLDDPPIKKGSCLGRFAFFSWTNFQVTWWDLLRSTHPLSRKTMLNVLSFLDKFFLPFKSSKFDTCHKKHCWESCKSVKPSNQSGWSTTPQFLVWRIGDIRSQTGSLFYLGLHQWIGEDQSKLSSMILWCYFQNRKGMLSEKRWKVLYLRCIPPVSWIPISLIGSKYNSSRIGHVPLAGQAHGSGSLCVGFTVDTSSLMNTNQPTQNPPPTHIAKFYLLFLVALLGNVFRVASRICWISASTHRQLKGEIEVSS